MFVTPDDCIFCRLPEDEFDLVQFRWLLTYAFNDLLRRSLDIELVEVCLKSLIIHFYKVLQILGLQQRQARVILDFCKASLNFWW